MLIERRIREEVEESLIVTGITLLSIEECEAARQYISPIEDWWWLRSPGSYSCSYAAYVISDGSVSTDGYYVDCTFGVVRPALRISNLKSFDLQIGGKIIGLAGHDWTVVSDTLALCDDGIGSHCFRKDWQANDANVYEASDVKKYLEQWAKEKGGFDG